MAIGTPPSEFLAIIDTGSDLTWTQCKPCDQCFKQQLPLFDPMKSSTYKSVECDSPSCTGLGGGCTVQNTCHYHLVYGDLSYTKGDLATETLTLEPTSSFQSITIGCGHDDRGIFDPHGSGLIGLGRGPLSFVSQISSSINGKFTYCLTPYYEKNVTGKISFGEDATVSGPGTVSTPLIKGSDSTFYYVTLEGISVGDKTLPFKASSMQSGSMGNMLVDSGTMVTFLPDDFFDSLVETLINAIQAKPVPDPKRLLKLCYKNSAELKVPNITAHFTGADVELKASSTFIPVDEDTVCLAMLPGGVAIFGNLSQMDYLVGYDLHEGKLSFKPTDCSKY